MGRSIQEVMPSASVVSNAFQPPLDQTLTRRPAAGLPVSWSMSWKRPEQGTPLRLRGRAGAAGAGVKTSPMSTVPEPPITHVAVRPDTTQRRRRQAVENDVRRALDDGVAASPGTGQVVGSHVRSLHQ